MENNLPPWRYKRWSENIKDLVVKEYSLKRTLLEVFTAKTTTKNHTVAFVDHHYLFVCVDCMVDPKGLSDWSPWSLPFKY